VPREAMDLLEEEERAPPFVLEAPGAGVEDRADLAHPRHGRVGALDVPAGEPGDDLRGRGLARPGRAPEDRRGEPVRLDHAAADAAGAQDLLLPDDLLEGLGAQTQGQRLGGPPGLEPFFRPQIGHGRWSPQATGGAPARVRGAVVHPGAPLLPPYTTRK